jgi:hypothetical protein
MFLFPWKVLRTESQDAILLRGRAVTPQVLGLHFGHLHCMSLSIICSYMSMEHMKHASATCETCVYGMCLQHLLETYATYFCYGCFKCVC